MAQGRGWQGPHPRPQLWRPRGGVARAPPKTSRFATPSRLSLLTLSDRNKLQHLPYALLLLLPALTRYYLFSKPGQPLRGAGVGPGPSRGERSCDGALLFLAQMRVGDLSAPAPQRFPHGHQLCCSAGPAAVAVVWVLVESCPAKGLSTVLV